MSSTNDNGSHPNESAPARTAPAASREGTPRSPRRLVLLKGDEGSDVASVLVVYEGAEVSGNRLHADLQEFAARHRGRQVAAEWLGPLGWVRFLWCRK